MKDFNDIILQKYSGVLAQANHDKILLELKVEELEKENLALKKEIEENTIDEDDEELL